ncbi:hypothetical protein [Nocardia macrotermitis]|uniref:Uncharacterized protein n=2 Tax=Nocardia macrotermitis TaxID=2585198 RepID=A0A7K0D593_9NOCA|nr:hypothetical protein [Nocardia macrotermitis]MQY20916.1 hypothetical protein [Nocardia macrotermitis]
MHSSTDGIESRISFWRRVREFAVPPSMIENATARRRAGDWAGACAAAGFDVDVDLRALACRYGREFAARVRADLRELAPDLLRWHMPRVAPDGLLRPGLTATLARYGPGDTGNPCGRASPVHLVVRTAPAWADSGQRMSLALWDESQPEAGIGRHPHPRPNRRFRFDLHPHLWDARRSDELGIRSGTGIFDGEGMEPEFGEAARLGCAVDRWAAEVDLMLRADGHPDDPVLVRIGAKRRVIVEGGGDPATLRIVRRYPRGVTPALSVLPHAATWVLPDLELLRSGALTADRLHPLVATALVPDFDSATTASVTNPTGPHLVQCRGEQHRIGLVDGILTALDHSPDEIRREELLVALSGTPLPCLQVIDRAHRRPDCLAGVRERLTHGDVAGALAIVENLLGRQAKLRAGPLRDELEAAARREIVYRRFRAGQTAPAPPVERPTRTQRSHPRQAMSR